MGSDWIGVYIQSAEIYAVVAEILRLFGLVWFGDGVMCDLQCVSCSALMEVRRENSPEMGAMVYFDVKMVSREKGPVHPLLI